MKRFIISIVSLILALILMIGISLASGSVNLASLFTEDGEAALKVLFDIRFPRIMAAVILGGALAVSGFMLQTFFNNSIAGPYILGVSSGAKLAVALTMIFFLSKGIYLSSIFMVLAAFIGSLLAMGFVLLISLRVQRMSLLIVCGILIGYICSAITDLCVTFADDSNIVNLHNWSLGSFSGISRKNLPAMSVIVLIVIVLTFLMSKDLEAYQLGENYARNLGVNISLLRMSLIILSSLLAACVTAFAGPISFVGIAVPHLTKLMLKSAKPLYMIPTVFVCGALVTLVCDLLARVLFAPTELSVSTVTAVLLAPVVIVMMVRKQGDRG